MPDVRTSPLNLGTYHMVGADEFEPQRVNNFEVQIVGLSGLISVNTGTAITEKASEYITLSVASYGAPQINVQPITVSYGNNKIKFAGLPEFPDSSIVMNDYIGINVENILTAWQRLVYDPKTQKIGRASQYKKTAYLIEYDPEGTQARQWQLNGCWPSALQLGEFNQEGNNVRQVTLTLTYDHCVPLY